jgi:hypothetical protein
MGETTAPVLPITAIYIRASSRSQDTASQEPDLKRWVAAHISASRGPVLRGVGSSASRGLQCFAGST